MEKKTGPIIGAVIIIILLVIAALYVWNDHKIKQGPSESTQATQQYQDEYAAAAASATIAQPKMSSSDDTDSIFNDLKADEQANANSSI